MQHSSFAVYRALFESFGLGKTCLFATKKELSGSGCNFQRYCHWEIFLGIDYEFNDFIQAIHRCYRFLQTEPVVIDIIYMENERQIKEALPEKWKNHDHMVEKMIEIVKKYGLSGAGKQYALQRKMGVDAVKVEGKRSTAVYDDYTMISVITRTRSGSLNRWTI